MKRINLKAQDRRAYAEWEELVKAIRSASSINPLDTALEIETRKRRLEADREEWFRYYFASYYTSAPAPFHLASSERFFACRRLYQVNAWSRELAKTARTMMNIVLACLLGEVRNVLYISNSWDNAVRLLAPIKASLEVNQRILQDYGVQENLGSWEAGEFITRGGCAFRALGAGQSPRGTRNENVRPDCIIIDDIDTDEECLNPERIKKKWKWIEDATIPAMSVSGNYRIVFNGNIIAPDCCIARAIEKAKSLPNPIGHYDIVNIRDDQGKSVWEKNSEEDIDTFLSLISFASGQKEFFNNPISEGEVFGEMRWGVCPPITQLQHLVVYADPSPSNSRSSQSSFKACFLVGLLGGRFYVYTGYLDHVTNREFVDWFYALSSYIGTARQAHFYIENNKLQDPFYEQVFRPLFAEAGAERGILPLSPDTRSKPPKFERIEGLLEPLSRAGLLILNEEERSNPHMKRLEEQFLLLTPQLKAPADGPDCIEGAVYKINGMMQSLRAGAISIGHRTPSSKRY